MERVSQYARMWRLKERLSLQILLSLIKKGSMILNKMPLTVAGRISNPKLIKFTEVNKISNIISTKIKFPSNRTQILCLKINAKKMNFKT